MPRPGLLHLFQDNEENVLGGLGASLAISLSTNPDKEAEVRKQAQKVGVPAAAVRDSETAAKETLRQGLLRDMLGSPATQRRMSDPNIASIAHDDVDSLVGVEKVGGTFGLIGDAFKQGQLTHELGYAGHELRQTDNPERRAIIQNRVQGIDAELKRLGVSNDGWLGFLTSAAEIIGQQYEGLNNPDAAIRVATGGGLGAATGLAGGIFAPVTVPAGTAAGLTSGFLSHLATDAFIVESGHSYLELTRLGANQETAEALATGVGVLNAGLEMAGVALVVSPIKKLVKNRIKSGINKAVQGQVVKQAAQGIIRPGLSFTRAYGTAVLGETATEVMQEVTAIAAEEIAVLVDELDVDQQQDVGARLEEIAVKTFKGMAILGLPGAGANYVVDRGRARDAKKHKKLTDQVAEIVSKSAVAARSPEVMAEHVSETLKVQSVKMPVEQFDQMLAELGLPSEEVLTESRLQDLYREAHELSGDVVIPVNVLTNLMTGETKTVYQKYSEHIRWQDGGMTAAEAKEFEAEGVDQILDQELVEAVKSIDEAQAALEGDKKEGEVTEATEVSRDTTKPVEAAPSHTPDNLKLAEDSLGLQSLFRTAEEAGMTPKQYEAYQAKLQRRANTSSRRVELKTQKKRLKQNSIEIKEQRTALTEELTETIGQEPVYASMRVLETRKLDRQSILTEFGETEGKALISKVRKLGGKVTNLREPGGWNVSAWADFTEFADTKAMGNAITNAETLKVEVKNQVEQAITIRNPELFSERATLQDNIAALMHDDTSAVLTAEITALGVDRKAGRLKPALIRRIARTTINGHAIRDVGIGKYINNVRHWGKQAGRMLRKGDRIAARQAKVNQLMNLEFAKEAEVRRAGVQSSKDYLKNFISAKKKFPNLGPGYIEAIRDVISQYSLQPRLSADKKAELEAFVKKVQNDGAHFEFPARLLEAGKVNYQDLTLHDFELLTQKVKELEQAGIEAAAAISQDRKNTIGSRVDAVTEALAKLPRIEKNSLKEVKGLRKAKENVKAAGLLTLNMETIVRELDQFQDLGPVYNALTRPINLATVSGYGAKTNIGLVNRQKVIAQSVTNMYQTHFSTQELNSMSKENIQVPGFADPMSRDTFLSILLNAGNEENRQAMFDSKQVTEAQLDSLIGVAQQRDLNYAQAVWDYLDSFWSEIEAATQRRRGFKPNKVLSLAIETSHGTYRGGYYPLRYDAEGGIHNSSKENAEKQLNEMRFSHAISSHTRADHTEARVGSNKQTVLLNQFVLQSHLSQVAYDLEMGDAVNEVYSVLFDKRTKEAFRDSGYTAMQHSAELWLRDQITGEIHHNSPMEKGLRWLRGGFTVSKLGWNVGVALIQVVGITQTAALIGKKQTFKGLMIMFREPWIGKNNVFKRVANISGTMAQREETFHKDISDLSQLISNSWIKRKTPAAVVQFTASSLFYGIRKMQRFVDTWAWLAAYDKGMGQFSNDVSKAMEIADRTVIRSQASGNFNERSAIERGTISGKLQQTEMVRTWTGLISYFIAKNNVAYELTRKTNFKTIGGIVDWAANMLMLYALEATMVGLIRGQFPDKEDEDENYGIEVAKYIGGETINALFGGVPVIREFVSEARGFNGGGIIGSVIDDAGKVFEQIGQGEIDQGLITAANSLGGTLFHYPSSQINKTGRAFNLAAQGKDVEFIEFLMGPKWKR